MVNVVFEHPVPELARIGRGPDHSKARECQELGDGGLHHGLVLGTCLQNGFLQESKHL